jgi:hypothetical protein
MCLLIGQMRLYLGGFEGQYIIGTCKKPELAKHLCCFMEQVDQRTAFVT